MSQQAVIEALRGGRIGEARAMLADMPDAPPLLVAHACSLAGDVEGEVAALGRVLKVDPRHLAALLAMGDAHQRMGDARAANSFFRAALGQAAVGPVAEGLHTALDRAQRQVGENSAAFAAHFQSRLPADVARTPRVAQALDLLMGRTELYLQQPSMFYFPGLPQRTHYERAEFAWAAEVESRTPAMQAELQAALADHVDFAPYVTTPSNRPPPNNALRDDPRWSSYYFWREGEPVADHAARCPETMAALSLADLPHVAQRAPMALWSLLRPGTHIAPHNGLLNTRLICHLPLMVPPGCAMRVGSETRPWVEGQLTIFDDSIEHEAWNRGTALRVVLLFEIWRPEITAEERLAITEILSAIDMGEA